MKALGVTLALVGAIVVGFIASRGLGARGAGAAWTPPGKAEAPGKPAAAPPPAARTVEDPNAVYRVPLEDSPARGPSDALVTIVEFSDLECPFCKRVAPVMKQVEERYRGQVRIVWKHQPLSMHRNALPAATVAEAAREKGGDAAFWAVVDELLAAPVLDPDAINRAGGHSGIDAARARTSAPGYLDRIRRDQNLAYALGASGTPTFFVNGRKLVGAQPYEAFKALIDEERARAEALVKTGLAPRDLYARIIEKGATAPVRIAAPAQAAAAPPAAAARIPLRADEALKGPKVAPVTIVLFSDFQCPFCARVEPTLRQLEDAYPGKIRIAWRHQPLPFHPNALPAAKAAEAARAQGKFWPMHDRLFAGQQALSDATYGQHAKALGLDLARFERDRAAEATSRRIAEDQQLAGSVGASGTPTLFVNCRKIVGAQPFEAFKTLVDEELKQAEALVARGDTLDASFYDRRCAANVAAAPPVAPAQAAAPRTGVRIPLRPDDPARGASRALVTVIEFSDFQCPFCSRAVPMVKELERTAGKDVRVVWKHLPLPFHPNAMPAAIAAEAARAQGKFWEMHDKLFADQQALSDSAYQRYARELGLDLGRFKAALAAPETRQRVESDAGAAAAAGVSGTPTFVVNGEIVVGAGGLQDAVRRQLETARVAKR